MNTLEAITGRRSIRKYKTDPVSDEQITTILKAAMLAPSARNAQPWEFVVLKSQEMRDKAAQANIYAKMAAQAPVSIVVCANLKADKPESFPLFWQQDCGAAIQNMLLAAYEIGLGTVWTGIYPREDRTQAFKELLELPDHVTPLGMIVIGYSDQTNEAVDRYDTSKIHYEKY